MRDTEHNGYETVQGTVLTTRATLIFGNNNQTHRGVTTRGAKFSTNRNMIYRLLNQISKGGCPGLGTYLSTLQPSTSTFHCTGCAATYGIARIEPLSYLALRSLGYGRCDATQNQTPLIHSCHSAGKNNSLHQRGTSRVLCDVVLRHHHVRHGAHHTEGSNPNPYFNNAMHTLRTWGA